MNKTKIDWATVSWNPVTGCRHGCPYCYARRTANRFDARAIDGNPLPGGLHILEDKLKATPYPFGFEPTFHRYRLRQPATMAEPQTVFVCSMADLFGRWVPTSWIVEVLDACIAAPQHRYLFLTKNPARYLELDHLALLPHENNFWYGSTVANMDAAAMYPMPWAETNTFWSMEPLLGPVDIEDAEGLPQWVILGAETGNRKEKVTPRREWVDHIAAFCAEKKIPVFYKDNLRDHFQDLPASAFPWTPECFEQAAGEPAGKCLGMGTERDDEPVEKCKQCFCCTAKYSGEVESMAIGYEKARDLMRQSDWKMEVTMHGDEVEHLELYHPLRPTRYVLRRDTGRKLIEECRVCGRRNDQTAIMCYDHDSSNENLI